jgi:hypothetical protein
MSCGALISCVCFYNVGRGRNETEEAIDGVKSKLNRMDISDMSCPNTEAENTDVENTDVETHAALQETIQETAVQGEREKTMFHRLITISYGCW